MLCNAFLLDQLWHVYGKAAEAEKDDERRKMDCNLFSSLSLSLFRFTPFEIAGMFNLIPARFFCQSVVKSR